MSSKGDTSCCLHFVLFFKSIRMKDQWRIGRLPLEKCIGFNTYFSATQWLSRCKAHGKNTVTIWFHNIQIQLTMCILKPLSCSLETQKSTHQWLISIIIHWAEGTYCMTFRYGISRNDSLIASPKRMKFVTLASLKHTFGSILTVLHPHTESQEYVVAVTHTHTQINWFCSHTFSLGDRQCCKICILLYERCNDIFSR